MRQRSVRVRQRGPADVAAWIAEQGGRDFALMTCQFFGRELTNSPPELLRGLAAEFGDELESWTDLRRMIRKLDEGDDK